ncbi:MAG: hypothetical protein AAGU05_15975, partial [Anaerolineaceae bacterium]
MSTLFIRTLREAPSQAVLASHQYLTRAGYVQEIGKGSFALLPFGLRAVEALEQALLASIGTPFTRIETPPALSFEGSAATRAGLNLTDPQGRQLVLAAHPGAALDEIAAQHLNSYRQLPAAVAVKHSAWEDEVHPGSGMLYSRMPRNLSFYGFFAQTAERDEWRAHVTRQVDALLTQLGLPLLRSQAPLGGPEPEVREWFFAHPSGRTPVYTCTTCGYTTSAESARFTRRAPW